MANMEKWQIELINKITRTHPDYDNEVALSLAKEWHKTDEKWMMITDTFCLDNDSPRVEFLVDRIELKFEKILKANENPLDENAQSWLWLCNQ